MTQLNASSSDAGIATDADRFVRKSATDARTGEAAIETALDIAAKVTRHASRYGEVANRAINNFKPYVAKSLAQRPMMTLAGGVVVGFVLGALWKR